MAHATQSGRAGQAQIPADYDAELVILGNCLLQQSVAPLGDLPAEAFYSATHQKVAHALRARAAKGDSIDPFTLRSYLAGDRSVQVSRLSGLTDGVPVLDEKYLAKYRARLQELQGQRETLRQAAEIGRAATSGATAVEIQERAQAIVERGQLQPAKDLHDRCPQLPESAWHPLIREYRDIIGPTTEAPDSYHFGSFLTLAGAALNRLVYFEMPEPIYPNLYCVLVGTAGEPRKGTAIARAVRTIRAAFPTLAMLRSIDSAEGFAAKVAEYQSADKREYRPVVIRLSELRSLIDKATKKGLENIVPALCMAYDCDELQINTRSGPVAVEGPFVALLAGTSRAYMAGLKLADVEGGLGRRLLFVPGEAKARIAEPPDPKQPEYNLLVEKLHTIFNHWQTAGTTRLRFDDEARRLWKVWYEDELPSWTHKEEGLISVLSVGYHQHAIKTATIYAGLDCTDTIKVQHLGPALVFVRFLFESLYHIFSNFGLPRWVEEERRIVEAVRATMPVGIRRRKLQQKFWKMGAETFDRRMKFLIRPEGFLRQKVEGKRIWVLVNEDV